jgi:hypothetical protein
MADSRSPRPGDCCLYGMASAAQGEEASQSDEETVRPASLSNNLDAIWRLYKAHDCAAFVPFGG